MQQSPQVPSPLFVDFMDHSQAAIKPYVSLLGKAGSNLCHYESSSRLLLL